MEFVLLGIWPNRKSRDSLNEGVANKGQTTIDGINRLVCTVKSSTSGYKVIVYIDGVEYRGVRFFQVSPGWRSHVKNVPLFAPETLTLLPDTCKKHENVEQNEAPSGTIGTLHSEFLLSNPL